MKNDRKDGQKSSKYQFSKPSTEPRKPVGFSDRNVWRNQSSGETNIVCDIAHVCMSCPSINEVYSNSLKRKYIDAKSKFSSDAFSNTTFSDPVGSPLSTEYRCHAKLVVAPDRMDANNRFMIGLYQPGTHNVVDIKTCKVHSQAIFNFLDAFHNALEESELEPYDPDLKAGDVRYAAIRSSHITGEIMLTVVTTSAVEKKIKEVYSMLKDWDQRIVSINMNINTLDGNAIFDFESGIIHVAGKKKLSESVCDLKVEISPFSFFQVNPWQAQDIYRRVANIAGSGNGKPALDLYTGTGLIAMLLGKTGFDTLGIEEIEAAKLDAELNVSKNSFNADSGEIAPSFMCGRVEDLTESITEKFQSPSLIVANPSRRGMDESVRSFIASSLKKSNGQLVYVSCEADSMIRDLEHLNDLGLKTKQVECYDMFPGTPKLEWIAIVKP